MKNKNIILIIIILVVLIIGSIIVINIKKDDINIKSDSIKFKEEYESLNDSINPKVTLKDNNPFVYANEEKVIKTLKSGTGIIYLGFPKCPWCRNAVNVLQYVNTDEILYLNMADRRDTYEVKDGQLVKTKDGTKGYYELLSILNDILDDYVIEEDNVKYDTKEKRIYVPLVIGVKDGKIVGYHADTVKLNNDQKPSDLLSENQKSELKLIYDDLNSKVSGDTCSLDDNHGC